MTLPYLEPFRQLFSGRENHHGQYDGGPEKKIQTLKVGAPTEAWERHLRGEGPFLGIVPIRLDNTCYFGAIDVDDDTINHQELAQHVKDLGLPLVVCRSKSGGAHLYLFLKAPVPAVIVQKALKAWAAALGHKDNADGRPIEIFPKQAALRPKDAGNWINLPYYGSDASTRKAVNPAGDLLTLAEFIAVAELLQVADATALTAIHPHTNDVFAEGPPCLQTLHVKGFGEGTRNSGLYNVAIFFRLAFPEDWKDRVAKYNLDSLAPPLTTREVDTVVTSVDRKDYSYNCDELPIQPHCQKAICNKRKFGVARLKARLSLKAFPVLTNLRKILTDPPRWIVCVDGTDLELSTDDITQLPRLKRIIFERLNSVLPNISPTEYDNLLRELLSTATSIDAPEDAGVYGQFVHLVEAFLGRRKTAESREDLLNGLPYEEKGLVYFRPADLLGFLERRKFTRYSTAEIYSTLRRLGASHGPFRTKKQVLRVWSMPAPKGEQVEDFDSLPATKTGTEF